MKQETKRKTCKNIRILIILLAFLVVLAACEDEGYASKTSYKYNLTGMGNTTGIVQFFQLVNSDLMHGMLGIEIMIVLFVMMFMSFMVSTAGDGMKSFAASSFISFVLGMFLLSLKLVPPFVVIFMLLVSIVSVLFIKEP